MTKAIITTGGLAIALCVNAAVPALAQKQAGWARLHTEYLSLSDDEAQRLMQDVPE